MKATACVMALIALLTSNAFTADVAPQDPNPPRAPEVEALLGIL